jgi:hypothetical protein
MLLYPKSVYWTGWAILKGSFTSHLFKPQYLKLGRLKIKNIGYQCTQTSAEFACLFVIFPSTLDKAARLDSFCEGDHVWNSKISGFVHFIPSISVTE